MRLGISGTYSSGKTLTAIALSNFTGIPRTRAKTMREILPDAAPGKTLEECTAAELIQMIVIRHCERAVHESRLWDGFVSDGCSLQEWIYGTVRVTVGINPNESLHLSDLESVEMTDELRFFEDVMNNLGNAVKKHVKKTFDVFVHLPNELPLAADGHRPVNERFRSMSDEMLQKTLAELQIPFLTVGGDVATRLENIANVFNFKRVMSVEDAIARAEKEYASLDVRSEAERNAAAAPPVVEPRPVSPALATVSWPTREYASIDIRRTPVRATAPVTTNGFDPLRMNARLEVTP
jgi:hypothetical protein